ncbi:glycosyltransferase [Leeuwenhoekiella sp. NPDC079379]|uniref:glycosyltransferase n=1 Tax=Leeuwenhoekiella sp. NPDC079379 TaxID=3364122 RepID=UPI0037C6E299
MNNKNNAFVSAIIPAYNAVNHLTRAIDSLLNQSKPLLEIIIVDDGSTDTTLQIAKEYESKYKIIRIISQENLGVSAARNVAIRESKGLYILMLDSDDFFAETFVEKAIQLIESEGYDAITCGINKIVGNKTLFKWIPDQSKMNKTNVLFENISPACCLFKRDVFYEIGFYDESFRTGFEDWDFNIRFIFSDYQYGVIDEYLFSYFKTENSRSVLANLHEKEIRKLLIKKYKTHYSNYLEEFSDYATEQKSKIFLEAQKTKNSKEYRLGKAALRPIRFLRKVLCTLINK